MKELIEKLQQDYDKSYGIYERLERDTFDSSNDEDYEDTVTRLYEEGYSDAIAMVLKLIKDSICVTCNKGADIVMHGHCGPCYYGYKETN